MQELKWVTKLGSGGYRSRAEGDVTLSIHCRNNEIKRRVCITFRKACYTRITKGDYIVFAKLGNRIYFKESNKYDGYKLTSFHDDNQVCDIKVHYSLLPIEALSISTGDYALNYDKDRDLYYIDTGLLLK